MWHALLQSIEDEQKALLSSVIHLVANHPQDTIPKPRLGSGALAHVGIDKII